MKSGAFRFAQKHNPAKKTAGLLYFFISQDPTEITRIPILRISGEKENTGPAQEPFLWIRCRNRSRNGNTAKREIQKRLKTRL